VEDALFHCQQVAEKALKAFLVGTMRRAAGRTA
jgi:HEPN domain-containing protein